MRFEPLLVLVLLATALACAAAPEEPAPRLTGDWLGQELPGDEAKLFAPGVVSTGMFTRDLAATPDGNEIFFTVMLPEFEFSTILSVRRVGGNWTDPEVAPFSGRYRDLEPAIAPDGGRLYFVSYRPADGISAPKEESDIWVVDKVGSGWGEPHSVGAPVNSDGNEYFPSVTRGGTLYFTRRPAEGEESIYRSERTDDGYAEPVRLPAEVNAGRARFNAFIEPDERFLIQPIYGLEDSLGATDYYINFRGAEGEWSGPIQLGERVNSPARQEYAATLSPDGAYLFFMSTRSRYKDRRIDPPLTWADLTRIHDDPENGNPDIYWIDAGFLESLRPQVDPGSGG